MLTSGPWSFDATIPVDSGRAMGEVVLLPLLPGRFGQLAMSLNLLGPPLASRWLRAVCPSPLCKPSPTKGLRGTPIAR